MPRRTLLAALLTIPFFLACPDDPFSVQNLQVTVNDCHHVTLDWNPPQSTPASFRVDLNDEPWQSLPNWNTSFVLRHWFSPKEIYRTRVVSLDAAGEQIGSKFYFIATPECSVVPALKTKILLVNSLPPSGDPTPWTLNEAADFYFGPGDSVRAGIEEASYGQQTLFGSAHGYFGVDASQHCNWTGSSWTQCSKNALARAILDVADPSIDFSTTDRIAILMSGLTSGGWTDRISTDEGTVAYVIVRPEVTQHMHELGHAALDEGYELMRIPHAGTVHCTQGRFPADLRDFAASGCTISSSGDFTPMTSQTVGADSVHYTALHKERMGYLPSDRVAIEHATSQLKEVTIGDVTDALPLFPTRPQLLRIPLGVFGYYYYVEYRNEIFRDGTPFSGVIVRLASPERRANWVDTLNASIPVVLQEGQAFDDPNHDVRIIFHDVVSGGVVIRLLDSFGG